MTFQAYCSLQIKQIFLLRTNGIKVENKKPNIYLNNSLFLIRKEIKNKVQRSSEQLFHTEIS